MENLNQYTLVIGGLFVLTALKLYSVQNVAGYVGAYKESNVYDNVSAMKHDLYKAFFTGVFPLLIFGLNSSGPFFDPKNIMGSQLTNQLVIVMSYFIFYQFIQPYVVNRV